MSAAVLREAAALMRARANDVEDGWYRGDEGILNPLPTTDAEHLASWHPAVALAVARWLEAESYEIESDIGDGITFGGPCMEAEAVATAYLGTSP